jgi:hypothetical protein
LPTDCHSGVYAPERVWILGLTGSVDAGSIVQAHRSLALNPTRRLVAESLEVGLPRDPQAPARARRLIDDLAASALERGELDRAKVMVSELVTNAVLLQGRG